MKARAIPRPLRGGHETGCVVCGRPLVYSGRTQERECCVCHRVLPSDAVCEAGHFVCDDCHSGGGAALLAFLQDSRERDPVKLFLNACALPGVHMHGPEHHGIVPCVLLTACANCGLELDLPAALAEAWARGKRLPGGSCGALGVCGAAAGAGIFASIACGASPLAAERWAAAQRLVSDCLARIAAVAHFSPQTGTESTGRCKMISILNRRELYTGTDAEDAARVWSTLKAEGIAYKMQTKGVRSSLARAGDGMGMGVTGGAARYSDYADAANYVYTIYVKSSDLARAKELLGL